MSTTTHTPPAHAPANTSGSVAGNAAGTTTATPPPYIDLPTPIPWADWRSMEASDIAALKPPAQFAVKGPGAPEEFPKLLYNATKRTTKVATSKDDETKDTGEGFSETPFPPPALDVTPAMIQHLETVFAAAAIALEELKQQVKQHHQQQQAGGHQATNQSQPAAPPAKK